MNFPTPRITDCTLTSAIAAGCDCVMLKHDGWPVVINCANGVGNVYTNFRFGIGPDQELIEKVTCIDPLSALFVGAKSRLFPTIYLYDTWWVDGQDVQRETYRSRYILTRTNAKRLDERFTAVQVLPIASAQELWKTVVLEPDRYKGLIFRRSKDTAAGELFVCRYYKEQPRDINAPSLLNIALSKPKPESVINPITPPSFHTIARAHQFLYYVLSCPVWEDKEFDDFCKLHNLELPVGSDIETSYTKEEILLARSFL